jgi:PTS system cellobiose-specific IIB component
MTQPVKICVVCHYPLSSSLITERMQEVAQENKLPVEIQYLGVDELKEKAAQYDVILLSPQVRFNKALIQELIKPQNIPVVVIPMKIYGLVQAEQALELALEAHEKGIH